MMTKQQIRAEIRGRRKTMSETVWRETSHRICEAIRQMPVYQQAQVIYAYLAKQGEVLLDELILDALKAGKVVAVPKVLGAEMEFFVIRDLAEVELGCMGIREPLSRQTVSEALGDDLQDHHEIMLLPAVAVDENCHRVGYGGGYYDKYLEKHPALKKLAVAFEFQVYPQVPTEPFDVPLDCIVTEERIMTGDKMKHEKKNNTDIMNKDRQGKNPMVYLQSPSTDAEFNLALEQYVFDEMDPSREYFMLWQNASAIIVGKNQNTVEEINRKYVEENGIQVVRRLSGGGAVYHDMGNLNFTFIRHGGDTANMDLHAFCRPIAAALQQLGVDAQVNGRNDITIDGRKFSGNSQYVKRGRIMHHGTLMFDSDLSVVGQCLQVSKDKIESKGVKSVRSRVTNIREHLPEGSDISLEEFWQTLIRFMEADAGSMERYEFTPEDLARVEEIRQARYGQWQWNYGYSPRYSLRKERRIEGVGKILISMEVKDGRLEQVEFYGDYFGSEDGSEVAAVLQGCNMERQALMDRLAQVDVERYFHRLTREQLVDILLQ
ncbi:MAG: 5-formyltetrahydrofolate cyclo-ligase [Lachnospiraceae bacterium]|nr:5-formyltetrahydrofolate cyclo-ligase [Lachnospiraceae bacterium]